MPFSPGVPRAGEKLVLHKLRFHPDFVAPFSPPCEGGFHFPPLAKGVFIFPPLRRGFSFSPLAKGGQGGWSRHDQSQGLPTLSPSQSFRIPLAGREESFSISKASASPPLTPPLQGGERDRSRSATQIASQ